LEVFRYISVAYSVLFAATALRLIDGLPHATARAHRYWVHCAYIVLILAGTVLNFWNLLQFRNAEWRLPEFVLVLGTPGVLYFLASTLVPTNPEAVSSWKDFYYAKRLRFFYGVVAWGLASALNTTAMLDMPAVHPQRGAQLALLILGVVGVSSARPSVHQGLVFGAGALAVLWAFVISLYGGMSNQ
jgi:hypothetical protein